MLFAFPQLRIPARLFERRKLPDQKVSPPACQACLPQPVRGQRLVDATGGCSAEYQPNPEIPIRRPQDRRVEAAMLQQTLAPNGRETEDEVPLEDSLPLIVDLEAPRAVVHVP